MIMKIWCNIENINVWNDNEMMIMILMNKWCENNEIIMYESNESNDINNINSNNVYEVIIM